MKKLIILFICLSALSVNAKISIVSSSTDLASIAEEIGGDKVKVTSLTSGKKNLHSVEILPSYMLKVSKADVYLKIGKALDYWADAIIDGSRNSKLKIVDCSKGVEMLELPFGKVDASMGDVHPNGNPHYWLNPANGIIIAQNIYETLISLEPDNKSYFKTNFDRFISEITKLQDEITNSCESTIVIGYHNSWPYLEKAIGIEIAGFIEPKPGIEPTASHTNDIINLMNSTNIKLIIMEPYFSKRTPERIAEQTNAKVLVLPSMVGGDNKADSYINLFKTIITKIKETVN
ncbi:MAG: zinc ABC transporter substrate-binding protein [Calditrichaeota bacterium]|nr:MAG: zinc ABC transporter substrate-binding protein [Calditrichota bacterium]